MPAIAKSQPSLKWRLTSSFPKSLGTLYGGAEFLAKQVAEMTDGNFTIQCFAAGEIVPGLQALDAAGNGTVEIAHTAPYYYVGKDPSFAFGSAIPFGLNARQQNAWLIHGGGGDLLNDLFKKYGVIGFPVGNTGTQMGGWFRNEIKTIDDLKGLKMRIAGIAGNVMGKLGVIPQQLAGGDIYPALEKGTIDAAEWVGPYDDEKLGFVRVAPYYYYPGWWEGGTILQGMINLNKWNELPKQYQAVLKNAMQNANVWVQGRYDALNPAALRRLVAAGAKLRPFSTEIMNAALKSANELYAEISAKNKTFERLLKNANAFRADEYLWWQVGEYSYDSFMIRHRDGR